ncbi:cyclase family protein [Paenibacillus thalictri]|uniref:Cyclase family protein n=1 Tax=Paenibacillus thalictri TaxID=2527873 RepID=A0A4Q9DVQ2_9BACL|nr:cyclase family protein [Paenibacillus thalictri]TBL79071.1 cyclase family protein [Paenibacillus thalictri]
MAQRIIDLSMTVHDDMKVFPRVVRPVTALYETWEEFAARIGAAQYGAKSLTATYVITQGDHVGTHMDAMKHIVKDAPGPEGIPLEYCFGDGVILDFRDKPAGHFITVDDIKEALAKIQYTIKPLDIVLIHTGDGDGGKNETDAYFTEHCGMTAEATVYLIEQGVKVFGIDAPTFDAPVKTMFETRKFWQAHLVMNTHEYYHLENMMNLDQIGRSYGFKLSVFPIKWKGTTAAPVRAVAIIEE